MSIERKIIENEEKNANKNQNDEHLVLEAQNGDSCALEELLMRYKKRVKIQARRYFLVGADQEDVLQEGMIGLYKAICDFQLDKQTSFKTFADLCISRQMINAVRSATRKKHEPLNHYISFDTPLHTEQNDEQQILLDILDNDQNNPEKLLDYQDDMQRIDLIVKQELSRYEYEVWRLYLQGNEYQQIAKEMNKSLKSIDNALQRIKLKLKKVL